MYILFIFRFSGHTECGLDEIIQLLKSCRWFGWLVGGPMDFRVVIFLQRKVEKYEAKNRPESDGIKKARQDRHSFTTETFLESLREGMKHFEISLWGYETFIC